MTAWGGLARRAALAVPTLVGLSFLIFTLISAAPGDPAVELARRTSPGGEPAPHEVAAARHELGLERPFLVQYARWLGGALQGDLGRSFSRGTSVTAEILQRLPSTVQLACAAFVLVVVLSVPLGVLAATQHRHWIDGVLRLAALVGASVPGFFLAYLLIIVFAVQLGVLPVAGRTGPGSLVLPAVALALGPTAIVSRLVRSSLLDVLGEDYIRTAVAKGLDRTRVVLCHGLRPAAIPVLTVLGGVLAGLLEGALIIEVIFAWPGVGQLAYEAVGQRDYPLVLGTVLLAGVCYVTVNLLVDALYMVLDPRVREAV
ncbi:MAG: ABC transporter permease [Pseudonocardiaceae bacterium]